MNDVFDQEEWVRRCVAHLLMLDPSLQADLARPIAEDLFERQRWRDMGPERAAQTVFDVGNKGGSTSV